MNILIYIFAAILLVCYGCDQSNAPGEQPSIDPAIVFGESIARVQIGNDSSTVVKKLGKPASYGDYGGYGDFRGYTFDYTEGILANTTLRVSLDPGLGLGVFNMSVDGSYKGTSREGIGINSDRDFVISKLGRPDTTVSGTTVYDTYYYDKNTFVITYDNQRIIRISMSNPKHK